MITPGSDRVKTTFISPLLTVYMYTHLRETKTKIIYIKLFLVFIVVSFLNQAYSTMEEHTCLIRENSSNLLLSDSSHEPFQIDKGKELSAEVTTLGPGNMARATPAMVSDKGQATAKRKAEDEKTESLEEQVCVYEFTFGSRTK